MKIPAAFCLLAAATVAPALAQVDTQTPPPKAIPTADPALDADPGEDWYQHGKNVYDSAKQNSDLDARIAGYAAAIDVFTRYLEQYPKNKNAEAAWWYLGQSYYGSGRVDEAKGCFHRLLDRYGKGRYAAAAAYTLAADHFNNRQYALAAVLFEKLAQIATTPEERQRGNYYSGLCYEFQGRNNEASGCFQRVISDEAQLNAFKTKAQFSLGRILSRSDKTEEALQLLDQVVNSPSAPEIRGEAAVLAGSMAAKLGKVDASDQYLQLVMATPGMEGSRFAAQLSLMKARFDQKRFKDVVGIFRQANQPGNGEEEAARLMLAGRAYMKLETYADALELFRQIEKLLPPASDITFKASYLRLICFYKVQGRHIPEQVDGFLEIYKRAHAKDPAIHAALLLKAESLMADRRTAEAAKAYAEVDSTLLDPSNRPTFFYNRAYCLSETKDPQGAIRSATLFIDGSPADDRVPDAMFLRAKAYADTGALPKAQADYDRIILRPDKPALQAAAWLLSADLCKQQNDLPNMILRYETFLKKAEKPTTAEKAKANYWLSWGLVKTQKLNEALPYADEARKLDPKLYGKNAGQLMCLSLWSLQQAERLGDELDVAIKESYTGDLPDQLIRWAAFQAYTAGRFKQAARFYALIADMEDPMVTPKEDWRCYGKSLLESGDPKAALGAIEHALNSEDNPQWKADGLLDKARAQEELGNTAEALKTIDAGLALQPQGRVGFGLKILSGDIDMKRGNPRAAASAYVSPLEYMDDADRTKPAVIQKMIKALEETKDSELNERQEMLMRYRRMMEKYPDWKP